MLSGMRDKIIIEKSTAGKDKNGNHVLSWTEFFKCYAYVNNLSGKEYWAAAEVNAENEIFFIIRYCSEIKGIDTEHYRIKFRGKPYNITFIDNIQYADKNIKIRAVLDKEA